MAKIKKVEKDIDWNSLSYDEMIKKVEELAGPRPKRPANLPVSEWSSQAMRVLKERYFLKDEDGNVIESLADLCWRVAWELARAEVKYEKKREEIFSLARDFYLMMMSREFLPNSPTLMNAGKGNGLQYSACYVLPVEDSLTGIFDGIKYQALVHQSGGGTGFSFGRLRPAGSRVKSTMGVASGPVSFMRVYNEATQQIKQGGMRRGANMGILRVDHPDIMEFIHCKDDGVSITNFNVSVTITDRFMEALRKGEDYDLIDPHTGKKSGRLSAQEVWDEIAESAWKTGDPGMIFIDRINDSPANPVRARGWEVEATNPCGEQPLYPFDACNLGSIFLKYYVKEKDGKKEVDWAKLKRTSRLATRMLDNVIEMNPFPLPQIAETVRKIRRIGLGVGGWANMLVELGIPYDSKEALRLAEKVMKFINDEGHKASQELALERGPFEMFSKSIYKDEKPIRNSTVTTIAPTGTIGILADCSGGIEPLFAIAYQHIVKSENRTLTFIDPAFEKVAKDRGFYTKELMDKVSEKGVLRGIEEIPEDVRQVFGTAHEIHPDWHIRMQAAFQKNTDNAVSKTINLPHDASEEDIKHAYHLAWDTGCRGITVFRDGCKVDQVLNLGTKNEKKEESHEEINQPSFLDARLVVRPFVIKGATYKMKTPVGTAFITINEDEKGQPMEMFINIGKVGSDVSAFAVALGRTISASLRFTSFLSPRERAQEIAEQLSGIGGRRSVGFGPNKIRSLPDAVSVALATHFGFNGHSLNGNGHIDTDASGEMQEILHQDSLVIEESVGEVLHAEQEDFQLAGADICPECGENTLVFEEGCAKCYACGHSEC